MLISGLGGSVAWVCSHGGASGRPVHIQSLPGGRDDQCGLHAASLLLVMASNLNSDGLSQGSILSSHS